MRVILALSLFFSFFISASISAQSTLPFITVKDLNNKIVISWKNAYTIPVSTIAIQRSYDSLKNFTTIGQVLSPQSAENGFADANAPYYKMYYRVFVSFEGGSYLYTNTARPTGQALTKIVKTIDGRDSIVNLEPATLYPWQLNPALDDNFVKAPVTVPDKTAKLESKFIFNNKNNAVVMYFPQVSLKKYLVKFFDANDVPVFELTKIQDEYLFIEKVNFGHSGLFKFEIYQDGILLEKNTIIVPKDSKKN